MNRPEATLRIKLMNLPFRTLSPSPDASSGQVRHKFLGLLNREPRWGLSWKGWLILASSGLGMAVIVFFCVYPFLAITRRVDSRILVVEGWINQYAIKEAVGEFQASHCEKIYATGGPVIGFGGYINDFNTAASVGAELLVKHGVPAEFVQMVPSRVSDRDRTYSSAVALREWFHDHHMTVTNFNMLTEGPHARRTWLLFQKAFGKDVKVGIISVPSPDYDAKHWWRSSEAVREVINEGIAYLYARFLFWPASP